MPTLNFIGKEKVSTYDPPFHILEKKYNHGGETQNKIIHGDNLLALKSLLPAYEGRVKCIYIDPPYNTGNEGWVYNDKVNSPQMKKWLGEVVGKEGEDLTRHDKWLCMMYPRLKLLKKLLSDDGAIFISIDDNEQAHLKMICDEIFGIQNFLAQIIWQKRFSRSNDAKYFCDNHDYLMVYAKNKEIWRPKLLQRGEEIPKGYKNPDNDPRGVWTSTSVSAPTESANGSYAIISPTGKIFYPPKGRHWSFTKENFDKLVADNRIYFGADGNGVPRKKTFLSEVQGGLVPFTIWLRNEVGDTQESKREVKNIFNGESIFDTPKPTRLIERIFQLSTDKNSLVLDSFAGSGTTAHAVLNLNKSDGGDRKFILIEMEGYAEKITAERVRRVGGKFDFFEVGEPLMVDGELNENLDEEKIREYIWFTETGTDYRQPTENKFYLGEFEGTGIYFHYEKNSSTYLDMEFLSTIKIRAENYLIYADECLLSDEQLRRYKIIFKKIPRDIRQI